MALITIVIPIIKFNNYSVRVISGLPNCPNYGNLEFLFVVSDKNIERQLLEYIHEFKNSYNVYVANNYSSNYLRSKAKFAKTEFVYFQDCDDYADYAYLNEFCAVNILSDEYVHCFNVSKKFYDVNGVLLKEKNIFHITEGEISDIQYIPTCVYSKIIPTKAVWKIEFPNLPFTQDWAISYQLFKEIRHKYINKVSYIYNNYPTSSSQSSLDTIYRLKRVFSYSRTLIKEYSDKNLNYESDFLKLKYNTTLLYRFAKLNVKLSPYRPSFRLISHLSLRNLMSLLYRTTHKYIVTGKLCIKIAFGL